MPAPNTLARYMSHNDVIGRHRDGVKGDELFWSLCHPREGKKERPCLKCERMFKSDGPGHRRCSACNSGRLINPRSRRKA